MSAAWAARVFGPALAAALLWPGASRAQAPSMGMRSGVDAPPDPACNCPCAAAAPAAGPALSDPVARLAEAKRLFQQGNELRKLGDCARAVVYYERSRALLPSVPNTMNAAYCLDQLGRADEAHDAYEALIADLFAELSADDKAAVTTALDALRPRLALLRASANVDGLLVVDGRSRGKLPLARDVRTVEAGPLAGEMRILVDPPGASLTIDGVPVGEGRWRGRLPVGKHTIEALELGYFPYTIRPTLDALHAGDMVIRLSIDESHPRWGKRQGTFWAAAMGGFGLADSLGSGAEATCGAGEVRCPGVHREIPRGPLIGVRGGYELPVGVSIFATLGYLSLRTAQVRVREEESFPAKDGGDPIDTTFTIADDIETRGPFFSVGGGYRLEILPWLFASGAVAFGSIFAETRNSLSVQAAAGGVVRPVTVVNGGLPTSSAAPFLMPELSAGVQLAATSATSASGSCGCSCPARTTRPATT